jgi:hypothetical protein
VISSCSVSRTIPPPIGSHTTPAASTSSFEKRLLVPGSGIVNFCTEPSGATRPILVWMSRYHRAPSGAIAVDVPIADVLPSR